jgi:hypothetical protein
LSSEAVGIGVKMTDISNVVDRSNVVDSGMKEGGVLYNRVLAVTLVYYLAH